MAKKGDIKLRYGLREGKIICISELKQGENGLACRCTCPQCGGELEARLGKKNRPHFAHYNAECDIESAQQTALHMLAKEIIEEEKEILLPGFEIHYEEVFPQTPYFEDVPRKFESRPPCRGHCTEVKLEKKVSDFIPDIVATFGPQQCLIEIAVTHFVDEEKEEKIKKEGVSVLEIDLSAMHGLLVTRAMIRGAVLNTLDNRKWIYNAEKERRIQFYRQKHGPAIKRKKEESDRKLEEYQAREQAREQAIEAERLRWKEICKPGNYKHILLNLRNDRFSENIIKSCAFSRETPGQFPFFLDVPITGEMIFRCDRRAWQSRIFDIFVYNKKTMGTSLNNIVTWMMKHQHEILIDQSISRKILIDPEDKFPKALNLIHDVIQQYLKYLSMLGFLDMNYGYIRVQATKTLCPPNRSKADRLRKILGEVDLFDPNIDAIIERKLKETE